MAVQLVGQNANFVAQVDALGNLYTQATPAAISTIAAPWTSATILGTTQILLSTGGFTSIIVQLNQTSTITGGAVTFEGTYDGINWNSISADFVQDPTPPFALSSNPYTLQPNTNHSVLLTVGGCQQVRIRLSSVILGTGSVTIYWTLQARSPMEGAGVVTVAGVVASNMTQVGGAPLSLGQTTMANSIPVTFASNQSSLPVTVGGTVAVTQSTSPWVVSGTVTANAGTGTFNTQDAADGTPGTSSQPSKTLQVAGWDGTNLRVLNTDATGKLNVNVSAIVADNVNQGNSGTNAQAWWVQIGDTTNGPAAVTASNALKVDGSAVVQPVSGTITANQGTSPWVVSLTSTTITGTVAVTQSGTWNIGTLTTITNPVTVVGDAASGSAKAGNPVQTGAVFNTAQPTVTTGQVVEAQATARGALIVAPGVDGFPVTVTSTTITGTVAVTQSTSPWVVSGTVTANAGTGNFTVVQGTASSLNATVVGTGTFAVQAAQSGTWTVQQGGAPWSQNLTQVAGTSLGATAVTNFGTAPAAVAVPGVNSSIFAGTTALTATGSSLNANITNTVAVTLTSTTITGTVAVTQSTSPWTVAGAAASGSAKSGNPVQMGGVFNTTQPTVTTGQAVELQATARGAQIVATGTDTFNVTVNAALPAGTNVIGHVITDTGSTTAVTGNVTVVQPTGTNLHTVLDSGTLTSITNPVTVAQATAANLNATVVGTLTHNNAAPITNNIGVLPAVASTAAPTYTTGDQVLLSTDLAGNLRVAGSLTVSDADTVGTLVALNALNVTATVTTTGQGGAGVLIAAGTLAATVVPEVSYDGGTTWVASVFFDPTANTTSANLVFTNPNSATMRSILIDGGVSNVRVRVSAFTSGTANATLRSTFNAGGQYVNQGGTWSVSVPGTVAVTQSTSPWVVSLTSTTITGTVAVTQSTSPWVVSGTVTANQGGAPWSQNLTQVAGTALGATAVTNFGTAPAAAAVPGVNASVFAGTTGITATGSSLNVNVTNTVPVTLTSTTITGTVAVTQSTSPWVVNTTQWASTALGTPQTFGTAPTGIVIGTSSDIYVAGTRARSNQATTAAGVVDVNIVGSLGATNSVTNGTFIAITDNTTKAGVIAGTTALKTDWSSEAGTAITTVPVAFGSGTPSGNAPGVNAGLFVGTTAVRSNQATTATGVVDTNLAGIKGTTVVTAAAGVQQVGIVGNAAATLDSANTAATAPTNALLTSAMYNSTVPTLTNGQAVAAEADTTGSLYSNSEGRKQTYRVGVVAFTPIASATAPAISITGSATKTVRITRIRVSITAGTGTVADISLKRFTALSGGTANSQSANIAKMDSGNAAQTAVVNQWSAAATTATAAGILNAERYEIVTAAVSVLPGAIEWAFGDKNGQSLVLRGTSEFAGFLISAVGTTPVADCWVEWTEE